jgi:predicted metal-dependent hydrolase
MAKIDRVIHSRRKTFALVIELDGSLTVRAPLRASRAQIERLVKEKSDWIEEKQEWLKSHPDAPRPKNYTDGEPFYYLGEAFPLEIVPATNPDLKLEDKRFKLSRNFQPRAAKVFKKWYHRQARQIIEERVKARAQDLGMIYHGLRITSAHRRWGSCGANGTLNFSWRLVMVPPVVIEYVIVHELVHLEIRNHSHAFWDRVAQIMPDYKQHIAWLKANGRQLHL